MSNTTVKVDEQANARTQYLTGLMWHAGAYLIISTLLIVLDLLGPGWLNWSFWIIGFSGFALAFHVLSYLIAGRNMKQRFTKSFAAQERHGSGQDGPHDGGGAN